THTSSSNTAMEIGRPSMLTDLTTLPSTGSICATVPEAVLTHNPPAPTASPDGPSAIGIVETTDPEAGSIRETVLSRLFATHTAPNPTATALGPPPTPTFRVSWLVAGSIARRR